MPVEGVQEVATRILNPLGQVLYKGRRVVNAAEPLEIPEVAELSAGSYYLQLVIDGEEQTLPFVKR